MFFLVDSRGIKYRMHSQNVDKILMQLAIAQMQLRLTLSFSRNLCLLSSCQIS